MENVNQIPKWFWIALGVILVITIIATVYCNNKSEKNITKLSEDLKTQIKEDIFDSISSLQTM